MLPHIHMNFFNPFRMVTGMHSVCLPPEGRRILVFCEVIFGEKIILYLYCLLNHTVFKKQFKYETYKNVYNGVPVSLKTRDSV